MKVLPAAPDCWPCGTLTVGFAVNVAVTVVFATMENVQTALVLPAQTPDQLANVAFALGTAVSVIDVFTLNDVPDGVC